MKSRSSAAGILLLAAAPAFSQQQQPRPPVVGDRIEVTGTRITGPDVESTSPVYSLTQEDVRVEGYQALELILMNLPQFVGDQGNRISNFATGTATVNLRGMFAGRTLVLLNGRRMVAGSPTYVPPDINQIPVALIKRVDVLTGGAAAVYGSDAVAGVVNFILSDRYEGVQGTIHHDFYNHRQKSPYAEIVRARGFALPGDKSHDGETTSVNLLMGGNFAAERGNATLSLNYIKAEPLRWADRDYSACALDVDIATQAVVCGGSLTGYPGRFNNFSTGEQWTIDAASGRVRRFDRATDLYNFAPLNYFQRPAERYGASAFAHYNVSPRARVYGEFTFHDDHTVAQVAAGGIFGLRVNVRHDNPLLTDEWRQRLGLTPSRPSIPLVIQRRNIEAGGRQADLRHTSFREVVGAKGSFARDWDYDVSLQESRVLYQQIYRNDVSGTRAARALDIVRDPVSGGAVCASVLDATDPGCVPYNVWTLGAVTPEAIAYLSTPALQKGFTSQRMATVTVAGDLGSAGLWIPGAPHGIDVVLGAERRTERLQWEPDTAFVTGDLTGQGASNPPVFGAVTVNELFGEARVPVRAGLSVSASYRHSDYDTGKTSDTFGVGFNFAPVSQARLRGSFQRAIRAPNLIELFQPRSQSFGSIRDPCAGAAPMRSLQECLRTGMTPEQYGRVLVSESFSFLGGGNPDLASETAHTTTFGIILTPAVSLSAAIDYFDIRLKDTISNILPVVVVTECLDTGNPLFCALISRDALGVGTVDQTPKNVGEFRVSGVDVAVNYKRKIEGWGMLAANGIGTYTRRVFFQPYRGASGFDCAGFYGFLCGPPYPLWRHRLRLSWQTPWHVDLATTWRYFHSVKHAATSSNPALAGDILEPTKKIKAMNYIDLAGSWNITKRFTLRAGINNLADRDPPFLLFGFNGNTEPLSYDPFGRFIYVNLTMRL